MRYFKSKFTGKILSENFAKCLDYTYGRNTINELIEDGVLIEIVDPSLEECILHGSGSLGVVRYRELNPEASWTEASKQVRYLRKNLHQVRTDGMHGVQNVEANEADKTNSEPDVSMSTEE